VNVPAGFGKMRLKVLEISGQMNFRDLFWHSITLTFEFDLLTSKLILSCAYPAHPLCQFASKSIHSFSTYTVRNFGNGRTDGRTEGHYASPASLNWVVA